MSRPLEGVKALDLTRRVADADYGAVPMPGAFPRMSETPLDIAWTGPALGEHTAGVLAEWLDMSPAEVGRLEGEGAV